MGVMTSFGGESSAGLGEGGGGGGNLLQCVLKLCCLRFKISSAFSLHARRALHAWLYLAQISPFLLCYE